MLQYLNGVVSDDPEVFKAGILCVDQAMADAWLVNLDAKKIELRLAGSVSNQRFPVAEADLKRPFGGPAENLVKIEYLRGIVDAILWPEFK